MSTSLSKYKTYRNSRRRMKILSRFLKRIRYSTKEIFDKISGILSVRTSFVDDDVDYSNEKRARLDKETSKFYRQSIDIDKSVTIIL